jgi:hypothetical protein
MGGKLGARGGRAAGIAACLSLRGGADGVVDDARGQHDRQLGPARAQLRGDLVAVRQRHQGVEHDDVDLHRLDQLERRGRVGRLGHDLHVLAGVLDRGPHQIADVGVVVDDHQAPARAQCDAPTPCSPWVPEPYRGQTPFATDPS